MPTQFPSDRRDPPARHASVHRTDADDTTVLGIRGEFDLATASMLTSSAERTRRDVVVDLVAMEFLDAAGIRAILEVAGNCRAAGGSFRLVNARPFHAHLLVELGLDDLLATSVPVPATARLGRMDPERLRSSLAAFRTNLPADDGLDQALARVTDATRTLFQADGAGIMLIDDERALGYLEPSDVGARRLETAQRDLGHGPCVDCLVLDHAVRTDDVVNDPRWPGLGELLEGAGVRAVLGVPVRMAGGAIGSLNVYRSTTSSWSDDELTAISAYAEVVEDLVGAALLARSNEQLAQQLQRALDNRVVIERAIGYQMATEGVDPVTAFDHLRRRARDQRRKLADLAAEIVDRAGGSVADPD